jgi:dihydrofolate reductase
MNTRKLILKMSISIDGFVGGPDGRADWIFRSMDSEATAWTMEIISRAGLHIMGSRTFYDMRAWWPYSNEPFARPMNEIPKAVFTKKGFIAPSNQDHTTGALESATAAASNSNPAASSPANPSASKANPAGPSSSNPAGPSSSNPAASSHPGNWAHPYIAAGNLADEIQKLKLQPGKDIIAHGGAGFAQDLVATGLIDEYWLLVHPVAVGHGLPIFSKLTKPLDLTLVNSKAFPGGCIANVYRAKS